MTNNHTNIINTFENLANFSFNLPDPEDQAIEESDFLAQLDDAWIVCDHFDLQTEIWRGRILRAIRDREKIGGQGRGTGFLNWLKTREISQSQAYSLIELANSADTLIAQGKLDIKTINNFSKRAFIETAKASPEIQQLITEAAAQGDRITRREVKELSSSWSALNSELLPDEIKANTPPRYLAPLVKELEKLPTEQISLLQDEITKSPDLDNIKNVTQAARNLSRYLDTACRVQAINRGAVAIDQALEEALRIECLDTTSDLVKQAALVEQLIIKLYTTWQKMNHIADRLYVDTGASTPQLRALLNCLESLYGKVIETALDSEGKKLIRIQMIEIPANQS